MNTLATSRTTPRPGARPPGAQRLPLARPCWRCSAGCCGRCRRGRRCCCWSAWAWAGAGGRRASASPPAGGNWWSSATRRASRPAAGLLALLPALSMPLLGAFPELHAALGPPSVSLLVGAFVFGLCDADRRRLRLGHAVQGRPGRAAEHGHPAAVRAGQLPGLGAPERLAGAGRRPSRWDWSAHWGVGGALAATWALALLALASACGAASAGWSQRWPARRWLVGRAGAGASGHAEPADRRPALGRGLRLRPVGGQGRHGAGPVRPAANAFWSEPGHAERLHQTLLLDVTSITNIGILAGALWVARAAPQSRGR
jgi:hypothetical protein